MLVVTGAGGFIGSVLAAELNAAGRADLVIVDRFGHGDKWRNIAKRDFFEIVPVDGLFAWLERYGERVEAVDAVISFDEETPIDLIRRLRPDVLVKGGDYTIEGVVGADIVQQAGGRVVLAQLVEGRSTSRLVETICTARRARLS